MEKYTRQESAKTPFIELDSETGMFEFRGLSIPENSLRFYTPLFEWMEKYCQSPHATTVLNFYLDYFNTSSATVFADLFEKLDLLYSSGKSEITINWHHQDTDTDMLEAGEDYKSITKIPFNFVSYEK